VSRIRPNRTDIGSRENRANPVLLFYSSDDSSFDFSESSDSSSDFFFDLPALIVNFAVVANSSFT
jgi:hypothetical protein